MAGGTAEVSYMTFMKLVLHPATLFTTTVIFSVDPSGLPQPARRSPPHRSQRLYRRPPVQRLRHPYIERHPGLHGGLHGLRLGVVVWSSIRTEIRTKVQVGFHPSSGVMIDPPSYDLGTHP